MAKNNSNTTAGIGFPGLLFLIFLVLKLTNTGTVATWSWWWISAPIWAGFIFNLLLLLMAQINRASKY